MSPATWSNWGRCGASLATCSARPRRVRGALELEPYSEQANTEMRKVRELLRRRAQALESGKPYDPEVDEDPEKRLTWSALRTVVALAVIFLIAAGVVLWLGAKD